jgi:hypothetical protein
MKITLWQKPEVSSHGATADLCWAHNWNMNDCWVYTTEELIIKSSCLFLLNLFMVKNLRDILKDFYDTTEPEQTVPNPWM